MERSKIVAVVTGAIALALGVIYLLVVQLLDFRGEMLPAPQSSLGHGASLALIQTDLT